MPPTPSERDTFDAFAVAAPGLEPVVGAELKNLRIKARVIDGGVEFPATRELLYSANLHLRAASRVVVRVATFRALTFQDLERRANRIPWARMVGASDRVQLRVTCRKSRLYHSDAVAERILNAITAATGAQGTRSAQVAPEPEDAGDAQLFVVRLDHDQCVISADTSGTNLHQRGYRQAVTRAPLRETIAAAMLLSSGWNETVALVDPFCGSGTIPIEAAMIARHIAPGSRRPFRFMAWPDFEAPLWDNILSRARDRELPVTTAPIVGIDRSGWAMRAAQGNAERAGVADSVRFERNDATTIDPPPGPPGWIVSNPPYGVRLGERNELRDLYTRFGSALRERFPRWHVSLLSTDRRLDMQLRVPLLEKLRTSNGGIRVHLLIGLVAARQVSTVVQLD